MTIPTSAPGSAGDCLSTAALTPGENRDGQDQKTQRPREIAMGHFLPGFAQGDRPVLAPTLITDGARDFFLCVSRRDLPIAAGPIRTAESGIAQPNVRTDRNDHERECRGRIHETAKGHFHFE